MDEVGCGEIRVRRRWCSLNLSSPNASNGNNAYNVNTSGSSNNNNANNSNGVAPDYANTKAIMK